MKKTRLWLLAVLIPFALTACGTSGSSAGGSTFSDEAYGTVTLCDYSNLPAEKYVYEITDTEIDEAITSMLYDYVEYNEVTRPSASGDSVSVTMTAARDGETILDYTDENGYDVYLGSEEFGSKFDEELTGVSAGDHLTFSVAYEEDDANTDFAGSTIDYDVTVLSVTEEVLPELTDAFVTDTLGYESTDAMKEEIRQNMESEHESNSVYELRENLIQQVIEGSDFGDYSQELYDSYAASMTESYESYMEMFGLESVDQVYEMFGMTEEDVEKEILNYVYRTITVQAISEKEKLKVTDEEYQEGLDHYTQESGYDSSDALIADYGEESLRSWILEDKVLDFLEEHASITETAAPAETDEHL